MIYRYINAILVITITSLTNRLDHFVVSINNNEFFKEYQIVYGHTVNVAVSRVYRATYNYNDTAYV